MVSCLSRSLSARRAQERFAQRVGPGNVKRRREQDAPRTKHGLLGVLLLPLTESRMLLHKSPSPGRTTPGADDDEAAVGGAGADWLAGVALPRSEGSAGMVGGPSSACTGSRARRGRREAAMKVAPRR